jgi:hypothetical protein
MKLKSLACFNTNDVPDHVLQEVIDLSTQLIMKIEPLFKDKNPNLILGAFSYAHAALIKIYVADRRDELEHAAKLHAMALIKNMDILIDKMEKVKI